MYPFGPQIPLPVTELKRERVLLGTSGKKDFKAFQLDTQTELRSGNICSQSFKENKCHRVSVVYKCATHSLFRPADAFIAPNSTECGTEDIFPVIKVIKVKLV